MPVYWTIQARRHLRQALAEALSGEVVDASRPGVLERTREHLDAMLTDAFGGEAVVVKDQVIGYRRKQDHFILLVEAFGKEGSPQCGPFVVKIGIEKSFRRVGSAHQVFFPMVGRAHPTQKPQASTP
jgi:hypothetical protein